jgi:hypothetical protein
MVRSKKRSGLILIFRRYKKMKDGSVLDAYNYGLRAWPMWVKSEKS